MVSCYSLFLFPMLRFVDSVTLRTSQKHYMYLCRKKADDHYRQNAILGYTVQLQFQATLEFLQAIHCWLQSGHLQL